MAGNYGPGTTAGGGFKEGQNSKGAYPKGASAVPKSGKVTGPVIGPAMKDQPVQGPRRLA
jgi:hypothetical protein